jgi:hypothetical protein
MTLTVTIKSPDGITMAADSRLTFTLMENFNGRECAVPSYFDNMTKLFKVGGQDFIGVVTFGSGALGQNNRPASDFVVELEKELPKDELGNSVRLTVEDFSSRFSSFFMKQLEVNGISGNFSGKDMGFIVAGYDPDGVYGKAFEISIPNKPTPEQKFYKKDREEFAALWNGQFEIVERIVNGVDPSILREIKVECGLSDDDFTNLKNKLARVLDARMIIPFHSLRLQDCIDLAIFLIDTTISTQKLQAGVRTVGGFIDVATITRTEGFRYVQRKQIHGRG